MPRIETVRIDAECVREKLLSRYGSISGAARGLRTSRWTLYKWLNAGEAPEESLYAMRGRGLPAELIWPEMPPMNGAGNESG